MKIKLRYYQRLRQIAGKSEETLELANADQPTTIAQVVAEVTRRYPSFQEFVSSLCFARNGDFARPEDAVAEGDTLDLMPPFSGG
jgi:molybdopterin converting factor small subunit